MTEAYPLQWPPNWRRTESFRRKKAAFHCTFGAVVQSVLNEIKLLGGKNPVISSNIPLRRDGLPYANQRQPEDVGVAVYFQLKGKSQCVPCDTWNKVEDNLRAIEKTISALRGIERWGAKDMVDAAFQGFQQLAYTPPVRYFDGFSSKATAKDKYREHCKKLHPDLGGKQEEFQEMQRQYDELPEVQ